MCLQIGKWERDCQEKSDDLLPLNFLLAVGKKVLGVDSKVTDVVNNASGEFTLLFLEGGGEV